MLGVSVLGVSIPLWFIVADSVHRRVSCCLPTSSFYLRYFHQVLASEWGKLSTPLGGAFGSSGTTGLGSGLAGMSGMGGMGGMGGMSGGGLTAAALGGGGFGGGKGECDGLWCSFSV